MKFFKEIPFLKLLLPFIFGILIAHLVFSQNIIDSWILVVLTVPSLLFIAQWSKLKLSTFFPYLFFISLTLFGFVRYQLAIPQQSKAYYGHFLDSKESQIISVRITSSPIIGKNLRAFAEVQHINNGETNLLANGKILLYFNFDSIAPDIRYGDKLLLHTKPQSVRSNDNPLAFNYDDYLRNRNIYYQSYISKNHWTLEERGSSWSMWMLANKLRLYCNNVISKYIAGSDNQAIASAMLLGFRNNLSNEIYDSYTDTGAVHVLAVSGLHVSIVNFFLLLLLRWWPDKKMWHKVTKSIIVVAGIWLFTLVTGAAPAVARAATMFTFFTFGYIFYKRISIYNILAFSAILLLLIDPKYILQGSFQFSYLALLSIVFFHPIIKKWYSSKYKAKQYIWNLIVVALSAQVLVFPVTIYYFHKFALSFWLSGIFAVVLAMFIIGLGLLLFISSIFSTFCSIWIGKIMSLILSLFISSIKAVQAIPYSTLHNLWLDLPQMLLLYLALFLLMILLAFKKKNLWIFILLIANIFLVLRIQWVNKSAGTKEIIVYDSNQNLIIDFVKGRERVSIKSENTPYKNEQFVAANYRLSKGINQTSTYKADSNITSNILYKNGPIISFENKLIYLQRNNVPKWNEIIEVDYLIIDEITDYSLEKLLDQVKTKEIILTHHMKNWQLRRVKAKLDELKYPYRYVGDKAVIFNLN